MIKFITDDDKKLDIDSLDWLAMKFKFKKTDTVDYEVFLKEYEVAVALHEALSYLMSQVELQMRIMKVKTVKEVFEIALKDKKIPTALPVKDFIKATQYLELGFRDGEMNLLEYHFDPTAKWETIDLDEVEKEFKYFKSDYLKVVNNVNSKKQEYSKDI